MKDPTDPMPNEDIDEEQRRREHMNLQPKRNENRDEEADRIRRLNGGGGFGGEV